MSCCNIPGVSCFLTGDGVTYKMRVDNKILLFEFSERFGPLVVGKRGQEVAQPKASKFYEQVTLWSRQGKRMRDGFCVWTPEPIPITVPMGGRNELWIGETKQEDRW